MNETTTELSKAYVQKCTEYDTADNYLNERITHRENQIRRLKTRRNKLECPYWINEIIEPIAKKMCEHFPDRRYEILGPFGLSSEVAIHFSKQDATEQERREVSNVISISFVPRNLNAGEIGIRDYSRNTGEYGKGTIGEVNGMNYPTTPITTDTTIADLVKFAVDKFELETRGESHD